MNIQQYSSKSRIARIMQALLVGLLLAGFYLQSTKVIMNSFIALIITFLPAFLERDYRLALSPALELWIASAVFLHALGSMGLYGHIPWWDHVTHSLSASVVAAIGYTTIRVLDLHNDEVHLPRRYMFVFILLTVIAFGVIWELFEYLLDIISIYTGLEMPLAQHGLTDTMKDMSFNTLGALIVAVLGHAYLTDMAQQILEKFR